jgi:hypothetical protein
MDHSRRIARVLGPTLIAVGATEGLDLHIWDSVSPSQVYLSGLLLFVAGLSIVHRHNRWQRGWPVLVTLVGWVSLLGGLSRMIAPGSARSQNPAVVLPFLACLVGVGVVLSFNAFRAKR